MAEIVVPFALTADEVNALDGTPIELASITRPAGLVVVPKRIEVERRAGTAYTVTRVTRYPEDMSGNVVNDDARYADYANYRPTEEFLVTMEEGLKDGRGPVVFRIPLYEMLTRATATCVVAFPETTSYSDYHDTVGGTSTALVLNIEATTSIADGTGGITGRVFFEEFQVS